MRVHAHANSHRKLFEMWFSLVSTIGNNKILNKQKAMKTQSHSITTLWRLHARCCTTEHSSQQHSIQRPMSKHSLLTHSLTHTHTVAAANGTTITTTTTIDKLVGCTTNSIGYRKSYNRSVFVCVSVAVCVCLCVSVRLNWIVRNQYKTTEPFVWWMAVNIQFGCSNCFMCIKLIWFGFRANSRVQTKKEAAYEYL